MRKNTGSLVLFALVYWFLSPISYAQQAQTNEEDLLTSVFPENCHFSGKFTQQKTVEGLPVPLVSNGDFFYSCDLGLVWRTGEPFKEAILYVNNSNNYRVDESGDLTPLTGIARYIMSSVFVKLLNGDTAYFLDAFTVSDAGDSGVKLIPESEYMKKGLAQIVFRKTADVSSGTKLDIQVTDVTGQVTQVNINELNVFDIDGKRDAFETCESLYKEDTNFCRVLRSPSGNTER